MGLLQKELSYAIATKLIIDSPKLKALKVTVVRQNQESL